MLQERIPGGEDELWTVGSYLDAELAAAGRLHRPQAAPVPARRRQLPRRRERLGRRTSPTPPCACCRSCASTASARSSSSATRATGASASWRSTPGTGSGTGSPRACGVNLSLAAYRDAIGDPFVAPRQKDGVKWIVANKDVPLALLEIAKRAAQRAASTCARCAARAWTACTRCDDPLPGLLNAGTGRAAGRDAGSRARGRTCDARRGRVTPARACTVFVDVPDGFAPRAAWVLETMLAPLGRRVAVTRDPAQAGGAALAYARGAGRRRADDPVRRRRHGAPRRRTAAAGRRLRGARERRRRRRRRLARRPRRRLRRPLRPRRLRLRPARLLGRAHHRRARPVRPPAVLGERLRRQPRAAHRRAGRRPLRRAAARRPGAAPRRARPRAAAATGGGASGEARGRFAVALTHDLDNLWRWTRRGFAAAGYRTARAARRLRRPRRRAASSATAPTGSSRHLPRRTDPFWTFPQILARRGRARRLARPSSSSPATRTSRTATSRRPTGARIPEALRLLAERRPRGRPARQRRRPARARRALARDRDDLAARAGRAVDRHPLPLPARLYHETLPLLEQAGFAYDTSLAFAEHEGFRCGCSFPFRPYSLAEERPLDLVELPLAVMDGTLQEPHYRGLAAADAERAAAAVLARALRSGGAVSLLWHNNRFDPRVSRGYDEVYWRLRRPGAGARRPGAAAAARRRRPLEGGDARDPRPPPLRRPQARRPAHLRARVPHAGAGRLRGHVHGARRRAAAATTPA